MLFAQLAATICFTLNSPKQQLLFMRVPTLSRIIKTCSHLVRTFIRAQKCGMLSADEADIKAKEVVGMRLFNPFSTSPHC